MPSTIYPTDAYGNIATVTGNQTITGAKIFLAGSATSTPVIIRGAVGQTNDVLDITNSTGSATFFSIDKDGVAYFNGNGATNYAMRIATTAATNRGLLILAAPGQTANLQEWQSSNSTVLAYVRNDGLINAPAYQLTGNGTTSFITSDGAGANGGDALVVGNRTNRVAWIVRGQSGQTASLQEWQNSGGVVLSSIPASGGFATTSGDFNVGPGGGVFGGGAASIAQILNSTSETNSGTKMFIQGSGAGIKPLVLRGYTGQTSSIQEWQNSAGSVVASVGPSGAGTFQGDLQYSGGVLYGGGALGSTPPYMQSTLNLYTYVPGGVGAHAIVMRGQSGQSGDYMQVMNSAGTVLGWINSSGSYVVSSSLAIKNSVTEFTSPSALNAVTALRPISYKLNGAEEGPTLHSFAVEEAHEVAPEIIEYVDGEPKGINLLSAVTMLAAAVKELSDKFDSLQSTLPKATG